MRYFLYILVFCLIVGHIQNDLISPSFPDMIDFLNTTTQMFYLISTGFSLGAGIGGIFLGPLSDSWGRKKTLLLGLILLAMGCIGSQLSTNIYSLICFRFIQGIGASAPIIVCVAMIFDTYSKQKARKIVGINNALLTSAKALAPIIGGYLNSLINWQINFFILGVLAVLATCLVALYIQVNSKNKVINNSTEILINLKVNLSEGLKNYLFLLSDKLVVAYICVLGFMSCALIIYSIGASVVYIRFLHVKKDIYGFYQGSVWAVFGVFCFLNHYFIKHTSVLFVKLLGFILIISGCTLLNVTANFHTTPFLVTVSMALCSAGFGLLITILFTDVMSLHKNLRGTISSIIAFFRILFVAINVSITGYFFNGTILPLAYIITILITLTIAIYIIIILPYN